MSSMNAKTEKLDDTKSARFTFINSFLLNSNYYWLVTLITTLWLSNLSIFQYVVESGRLEQWLLWFVLDIFNSLFINKYLKKINSIFICLKNVLFIIRTFLMSVHYYPFCWFCTACMFLRIYISLKRKNPTLNERVEPGINFISRETI